MSLRTKVARDAVPSRPGSEAPPTRRPSSDPPPPTWRRSSRPPPGIATADPRTDEARGVYAERVRTSLDALGASMPEPPPPDRRQRIEALVRELAGAGPEADLPVQKRVLAMGADALPFLASAFPGALWVDLSRPHRPLRTGRKVSAIAACLAAFGEPAVPHVIPMLRAPEPALRVAAALIAADLAHDALVAPLAARLWDDSAAVRNAAMIALGASAHLAEMRKLQGELAATLSDPSSPEGWRAKAAWTVGQLRDPGMAPLLIEQLAAEAVVARIARRSLVLLVGRDLGRFRVRWRRFFAQQGDRSRIEWLIDALDQADERARARALDELVLATGEGFERRAEIATREGAQGLAALYRERFVPR